MRGGEAPRGLGRDQLAAREPPAEGAGVAEQVEEPHVDHHPAQPHDREAHEAAREQGVRAQPRELGHDIGGKPLAG